MLTFLFIKIGSKFSENSEDVVVENIEQLSWDFDMFDKKAASPKKKIT